MVSVVHGLLCTFHFSFPLLSSLSPFLLSSPSQEEASSDIPPNDGIDLPDDVANRMSLFYANPTPMLNTLSGAAEKLLQEVDWCDGVMCDGVMMW